MQEAWSHDRPELSWEPEMNQSELIERLVIAVRRHPYL
jgi:hypothetical protein